MDDQMQKQYRSGIGSLLYLVKHSQLDFLNTVCKLSKVIDGANGSHMKAFLRAVKFVQTTQDYKLIMRKMENREPEWILKAYSDSDYAGDSEGC